MKPIKYVASTLVMALLTQSAFAGGGAHGEDGVYVNNRIVIREYIEENEDSLKHVDDNRAFLEATPGFTDLIKEVGLVNPLLALAIWNQLIHADLWLTPIKLPIFPEGVTHLTGPKTDVQIAARYDNDIVISLPVFNERDQEYTLAHEALHGLVSGEGPFHHKRVRDVVRYFLFHRGRMNKDELDKILVQSQVDYHANFLRENNGIDTRALAIFLQSQGSIESQCLLKEALIKANSLAKELENYGPTCGAQNFLPVIKAKAPASAQLIDALVATPLADMAKYTVNIDGVQTETKKRLRKKWLREIVARDCGMYASPTMKQEIDDLRSKHQDLIIRIVNAKTEIARLQATLNGPASDDINSVAAVLVALTDPSTVLDSLQNSSTYWYNVDLFRSLDQAVVGIQNTIDNIDAIKAQVYETNVQECATMLGPNYIK